MFVTHSTYKQENTIDLELQGKQLVISLLSWVSNWIDEGNLNGK
jgi:hypothetical protein